MAARKKKTSESATLPSPKAAATVSKGDRVRVVRHAAPECEHAGRRYRQPLPYGTTYEVTENAEAETLSPSIGSGALGWYIERSAANRLLKAGTLEIIEPATPGVEAPPAGEAEDTEET